MIIKGDRKSFSHAGGATKSYTVAWNFNHTEEDHTKFPPFKEKRGGGQKVWPCLEGEGAWFYHFVGLHMKARFHGTMKLDEISWRLLQIRQRSLGTQGCRRMDIGAMMVADKSLIFPFCHWHRPKHLTCQIMLVGHLILNSSAVLVVGQGLVSGHSTMERQRILDSRPINSASPTKYFWRYWLVCCFFPLVGVIRWLVDPTLEPFNDSPSGCFLYETLLWNICNAFLW